MGPWTWSYYDAAEVILMSDCQETLHGRFCVRTNKHEIHKDDAGNTWTVSRTIHRLTPERVHVPE